MRRPRRVLGVVKARSAAAWKVGGWASVGGGASERGAQGDTLERAQGRYRLVYIHAVGVLGA